MSNALDQVALDIAIRVKTRRTIAATAAYALLRSPVPWERLSDDEQEGYRKIVEYFESTPHPCPECRRPMICRKCRE